ncbi:MAG: patatin-like phospholipase family protein [Pseudobdellovibrionaceae bacterium]
MSLALVLSGGGARAAYQAGVISAIVDISSELGLKQPFDLFTGVSAGALNAAMLAAAPQCNLTVGSKRLIELWSLADAKDVYVSDPISLTIHGLQLMAELSLGGLKTNSPRRALLDTKPLKTLISDNLEFGNIQKNIDDNKFQGLAITALDYFSSSTITFIQGHQSIPEWQRVRRSSERTSISANHILASASIPLLFPPITIGDRHFGDGSIRNFAPCGPAIYMGATKILAVGVRRKQDICYTSRQVNEKTPPTIGRVASVLLHTLMMDGFEIDIDRIERVNANIAKLSETERRNISVRTIDHLWLSPSRDISEIASRKVHQLPSMIRYLLRGLGSLQDASEIASFLLFEPSYCAQLIEIGFEDAIKNKERIRQFLVS